VDRRLTALLATAGPGQGVPTGRDVEPEDPRPADRRERPCALDRDLERGDRRGRSIHRLAKGRDLVLVGQADEAQGEVEAVEADPADVADRRVGLGSDALDERRHRPEGRLRERDRDEDAAAAGPIAGVPGGRPVGGDRASPVSAPLAHVFLRSLR